MDKRSGQVIDFHETIDGGLGRARQSRWQFNLFESGNTRFNEVNIGGGYQALDRTFECGKQEKIEVTSHDKKERWNMGRPVGEISFSFGNSCVRRDGKEVCDIKIADSVGLKEEKSNTK